MRTKRLLFTNRYADAPRMNRIMKREPLPQALRTAIRRAGKTVYEIAKDSGVAHPIISRFLAGKRDIRLETAEKLAQALGLQLK